MAFNWDEIMKRLGWTGEKGQSAPTQAKDFWQASGARIRGKAPSRSSISGNEILSDSQNLTGRIQAKHMGKMVMFFYNAKWKDKLPYWDRFPLVIPIELYNDGFLGLNLHYLPPKHRAVLLDAILKITEVNKNNPQKSIRLTYNLMKTVSRTRLYIPCVKRYLYTPYVKSKFYVVPRPYYFVALFLPLERFQGAAKQRVYNESIKKAR